MTKKTKKTTATGYPEVLKLSAAAWKEIQEKHIQFARDNAEAYFAAIEAALEVTEQEELSTLHTEYVKSSVTRQIEQAGEVAELTLKAHQAAAEALGYQAPTYAPQTTA